MEHNVKKKLILLLGAVAALAAMGGFAIASQSGGGSVQIAVWQSASEPSQLHLSTRVEGGGWTTGAPLTLEEKGESGRYLRSEIVSVEVPAPSPYKPVAVGATATARMQGADGADMGTVTIEQGPRGLIIQANVHGLSEGGHGFHIHEHGACEPDFTAAGGHLNLEGRSHGERAAEGTHTGDLPNIYAGPGGVARADVFTDKATLDGNAPHTLFDADGSAIIIHAGPDDYLDMASAGGRVACGVILLDS